MASPRMSARGSGAADEIRCSWGCDVFIPGGRHVLQGGGVLGQARHVLCQARLLRLQSPQQVTRVERGLLHARCGTRISKRTLLSACSRRRMHCVRLRPGGAGTHSRQALSHKQLLLSQLKAANSQASATQQQQVWVKSRVRTARSLPPSEVPTELESEPGRCTTMEASIGTPDFCMLWMMLYSLSFSICGRPDP